jgi:predicted transcriptional regulator
MSRYDEGNADIGKSCALGHRAACAALAEPR